MKEFPTGRVLFQMEAGQGIPAGTFREIGIARPAGPFDAGEDPSCLRHIPGAAESAVRCRAVRGVARPRPETIAVAVGLVAKEGASAHRALFP